MPSPGYKLVQTNYPTYQYSIVIEIDIFISFGRDGPRPPHPARTIIRSSLFAAWDLHRGAVTPAEAPHADPRHAECLNRVPRPRRDDPKDVTSTSHSTALPISEPWLS